MSISLKINGRYILGVVLLVMGLMAIVTNLQILGDQSASLGWAIIWGVGGAALYYFARQRPEQVWLILLAVIMFGFAASRVLLFFPETAKFSALAATAWVGLTLLTAVFLNRQNWLALIPAGIFLSLGAIEAIHAWNLDIPAGGILFIGLGLSFLVLFFLPAKLGKSNWALAPAVILLALGALASYQDISQASGYLLPILLLLAGAAVLIYTFKR